MSQHKKIPLLPILLVNFIGTLGFSIVIPFLVFLVKRYGGSDIIYGIIGATYPAFQLIGAPILGRWSDTSGRRKILLLSQIGTALSWAIFLVALFIPVTTLMELPALGGAIITLPLLLIFLARACDGLTGGNVSVAQAYLADITQEKDRKANYGKMGASSNLGFIIGPALAGVLGATALGATAPVLAAFAISIIAIAVIAVGLPESNHRAGPTNPDQKKKGNLRYALSLPQVPYALLLNFIIFFGFSVFYTAFPLHAMQGLSWTVAQMGTYFAVLSAAMVVVQGPVLSWVSKKCSDRFLIMTGSLILGSAFLAMLSGNAVILYIGALLFALGNGLMWPSFLAALSIIAGKKDQGLVQGYASSAGSLASIAGLILGGILYAAMGVNSFVVSGVVIYSVFILSRRLDVSTPLEKN